MVGPPSAADRIGRHQRLDPFPRQVRHANEPSAEPLGLAVKMNEDPEVVNPRHGPGDDLSRLNGHQEGA